MIYAVPRPWKDRRWPRTADFYCTTRPDRPWDALRRSPSLRHAIGAISSQRLRPARWTLSKDGIVVLASETGVLDFTADNIDRKGRLEPGRMFLVDTEAGRIVEDDELKDELCRKKPYGKWLRENKISLHEIELPPNSRPPPPILAAEHAASLAEDVRLHAGGHFASDGAMAQKGEEAIARWHRHAAAVLSDRPQLLFNISSSTSRRSPTRIDPIREDSCEPQELHRGEATSCTIAGSAQQLELEHTILTNSELTKVRGLAPLASAAAAHAARLYPVSEGGAGLKAALDELCRRPRSPS